MLRKSIVALAALTLAAAPAAAQDKALGQAAVGAEAGAYLGGAFSHLAFYNDGQAAIVGALAGSVLGTLALAPVGTAGRHPASVPEAAKPPVALRIECRNVTSTVELDGKKQDLQGLACKQPDGSWKMQP